MTLFDKHQAVSYDRRPSVRCQPPSSLGLVANAAGTWLTLEGFTARQAAAARLAACRPPRVV
jgi:hypothetical protein